MNATDKLRIAVDLARRPLSTEEEGFLVWVYHHRSTLAWGLPRNYLHPELDQAVVDRGLALITDAFLVPTPLAGEYVRYLYEF